MPYRPPTDGKIRKIHNIDEKSVAATAQIPFLKFFIYLFSVPARQKPLLAYYQKSVAAIRPPRIKNLSNIKVNKDPRCSYSMVIKTSSIQRYSAGSMAEPSILRRKLLLKY